MNLNYNFRDTKLKSGNLKLTPEKFKELLGYYDCDQGEELNLNVLKEEEFDQYSRKLIEYTVRLNEKVQAYLLIPKNKNKSKPGILAIHANKKLEDYKYGKSTAAGIAGNSEFNYGLELCQKGYVVICPDRFPYESRNFEKSNLDVNYGEFRASKSNLEDTKYTNEFYRIYMCHKCLYDGYTEIGKELLEMQKAVDVLQGLEEVDSEKIGVIGASEGGMLAMLSMYIDDRIKVGCINYNLKFPDDLYNDSVAKLIKSFDMYLTIPKLKQYGNIENILCGIAPRPFMITQSEESTLNSYSEKLYEKIKENYLDMRIPNKFSNIIFNSNSFFPQDVKNKCYYWLEKWI